MRFRTEPAFTNDAKYHRLQLCDALDSANFPCDRIAKEEVNGHHLCGIHIGMIGRENIARQKKLTEYKTYQEKEFETIAKSLSNHDLAKRQRDLDHLNLDNVEDFRRVRVEVERAAVAAELKRRSAAQG